jgi:NAD(P)-dependent dehydrogenase (short-subunit alcohol dehydrogenase family)
MSKYALVTGGRRGIGRAIVNALVSTGCKVAIIGKSDDACDLQEEMQENYGSDVPYFKCDLADENQTQDILDRIIGEFGRIDILVNNSGIQKSGYAINQNIYDFRKTVNVNLVSPYQTSCWAFPYMCKESWGRIINIASIAGLQPAKKIAAYATSKAGLIMLTQCLSREWAGFGITVNAIAPGFIQTDMLDADAVQLDRIPIGRIGKPEDVAGVVKFLCSKDADYITGKVITVDGGWL